MIPERRRGLRSVAPFADALAHATNANPAVAFFLLTLLYIVAVTALSSLKLLWLDELITLFIVRLGSLPAIWHALQAGADPNPPFSHLCVLISSRIFGQSALALRLPSALGYWCGLAALFVYLKRRFPPVWALMGTLLFMAMACFDYSFESRSYGIVCGLTMLSFLSWTVAVSRPIRNAKRRVAIACMTLSLLLGVCTNYFAVLAIVPIAVGEIVRLVAVRQQSSLRDSFQPTIWAGLFLSATPLLFFRPLIAVAIEKYAPYAWNRVSIQRLIACYTETIESTLIPLLLLLFVAVLFLLLARTPAPTEESPLYASAIRFASRGSILPPHERAAVIVLTAYPLLGYMAALLHGGMLSPRFVLPVCFGFAIAGMSTAYRMSSGKARIGAALVCLFAAWFCARECYVGYTYAKQRESFSHVLASLSEVTAGASPDVAIAVPDPLLALPLEHYSPALLRQRLAFPLDFPAVRQFRHDDSPEQNLWAGRALLPSLRILPLAQFQSTTDTYLIVAADRNWLLQDLSAHQYSVTRLPVEVRAENIGGFTPLAHGRPEIYLAHGDLSLSQRDEPSPIPFQMEANLPTASRYVEPEVPSGETHRASISIQRRNGRLE